jgi:hypothetical protein
MEDIAPAFEALIDWTKDSGHTLAGPSRELYHHWDDEDPAGHVTELQLLLDPPNRRPPSVTSHRDRVGDDVLQVVACRRVERASARDDDQPR